MAVLTSLGVRFYIGSRTGATTTEPTQLIPQVIEATEFDIDPDTIDTTSFDNLRYKSVSLTRRVYSPLLLMLLTMQRQRKFGITLQDKKRGSKSLFPARTMITPIFRLYPLRQVLTILQ